MSRDARFPRGSPPLREALAALALSLAVLVVVEVCAIVAAEGSPWLPLTLPLVGAVYAAAGLVAWQRRPRNRIGLLLVLGGLANLVLGAGATGIRSLEVIGAIVATVPLAVIVHLLLAFPSGRLHGRWAIGTVVVAYVNSVVLQAPAYLFAGAPDGLWGDTAQPQLMAVAQVIQRWIGVGIVVAASTILVRRLARASARQRRVLAPLDIYGICTVLAIPLSHYVPAWFGLDPIAIYLVQLVALIGIPVAFAISLLRGGFEPAGDVDDLARWLGGDPSPAARPRMAQALAATLGDPSLRVAFDVEPQDRTGAAALRDGLVEVDLDGRRVAQITYDPVLIADRGQVEAAGRVVALALDRERLTDELTERGRELQQSQIRLVEAQDQERRRIVRDLHDGLQSQLVLLSRRAATLAKASASDHSEGADQIHRDAAELHRDLDLLSAEVRGLIHGLMPALLTEQGLFAAVEDLAEALPLPARVERDGSDQGLPGAVETTMYFIAAESLTNVVKHASARRVEVSLQRLPDRLRVRVCDDGLGGAVLDGGSGLRGLRDRVEALGGRLRLESPAGSGTSVEVEVPCGR